MGLSSHLYGRTNRTIHGRTTFPFHGSHLDPSALTSNSTVRCPTIRTSADCWLIHYGDVHVGTIAPSWVRDAAKCQPPCKNSWRRLAGRAEPDCNPINQQ